MVSVYAASASRVITRDHSPRFAAPGHRIRLGNIAERASAERVRNLGSCSTKLGDKVELLVTSKPASAHNRCAYEQRHSLVLMRVCALMNVCVARRSRPFPQLASLLDSARV